MRDFLKPQILFCFSLILLSSTAMAWRHGISLGYGGSNEVGYSYQNHGWFLNTKLYKFKKIDKTLIFTIDGSLGYWHATTDDHKDLTTAALSGAFRAYFYPPENQQLCPYLLLSFGPTYLSHKHFGKVKQGAHFAFQSALGAGSEFTIKKHNFDANLCLLHYCNAGLASPNQGIDIFFVFSLGYLF